MTLEAAGAEDLLDPRGETGGRRGLLGAIPRDRLPLGRLEATLSGGDRGRWLGHLRGDFNPRRFLGS